MNESYFHWFPFGNNFPQIVRVFRLKCVNTVVDGKDIVDINHFFILPSIECTE